MVRIPPAEFVEFRYVLKRCALQPIYLCRRMKIPSTDSYIIPKNSSYFTELHTRSLILLTTTVTTENSVPADVFPIAPLSLSPSLIAIIIVVFKHGSLRFFMEARGNNRLAIASNEQAIITGHQGRFNHRSL